MPLGLGAMRRAPTTVAPAVGRGAIDRARRRLFGFGHPAQRAGRDVLLWSVRVQAGCDSHHRLVLSLPFRRAGLSPAWRADHALVSIRARAPQGRVRPRVPLRNWVNSSAAAVKKLLTNMLHKLSMVMQTGPPGLWFAVYCAGELLLSGASFFSAAGLRPSRGASARLCGRPCYCEGHLPGRPGSEV